MVSLEYNQLVRLQELFFQVVDLITIDTYQSNSNYQITFATAVKHSLFAQFRDSAINQ